MGFRIVFWKSLKNTSFIATSNITPHAQQALEDNSGIYALNSATMLKTTICRRKIIH